MREALALSGGGVKVAFAAGAIEELAKGGYSPDWIGGVSAGACLALLYGQAPDGEFHRYAKRGSKLWSDLPGSKGVYRKSWAGKACLLWRPYLFDNAPLRALLARHLDENALASSPRTTLVGAVDMRSGADVALDLKKGSAVSKVLGSSSIPLAMPCEPVGDYMLHDGGVRTVTMVPQAVAAGASRITAVLSHPLEEDPPARKFSGKSTIETAQRAIEILTHEVFVRDLDETRRRNSPKYRGASGKAYRKISITVIAPKEPIDVNPLDFSPKLIKALIEQGREAARGVS